MKAFFIVTFFAFLSPSFAEDGGITNIDDIEMNINDENYILFEDESLVVCDRKTDEYLVEITPGFDLYIRGKKEDIDEEQRDLIEDYYIAQYMLYIKRNRISAKGIEIGIQGARLAAKAVSGAFMLMANGFDEEEERQFEENMEREAEEIERNSEMIDSHVEDYEDQIYNVNNTERIMSRKIRNLQEYALFVDEDVVDIDIIIDDKD